MPQIVSITERAIRPAQPNLLQQRGLLVSKGGTNLKAGDVKWITGLSDLSTLLAPPADKTDTSTSSTTALSAAEELQAMASSWFANNNVTGVYLFEAGSDGDIAKALSTLLANAPLTYYAIILPRNAASDPNIVSLAANFDADNARCYFFFTETSENYQPLIRNGEGQKSIACAVEYTGGDVLANTNGAVLTQEHAGAALAAQWIGNPPSISNRLAPMNFRQLVGITAWPDAGNLTKMAQMKQDNVNFPGTATQAGVQMTITYWGRFMNGDPMSGWYGADYTAITAETALANLLVEGQQPGSEPLTYSPMGISEIFAKLTNSLDSAVAVGCILGSYNASFVPFGTYVSQNPSDYGMETYNGLSAEITPIRGFDSLNMTLEVDFTGQSAAAGSNNATSAAVQTRLLRQKT